MPETESSSSSAQMNDRITQKLREYACVLRASYRAGDTMESLRSRKSSMVSEVYRMLCTHLGEPPTEFHWQWRTKEKVFHRDGTVTPQQFYEKHVGIDLDSMVCLIHCPMESTPLNKLYTVSFLGNTIEGRETCYLNVDLDTMKRAAVAQLKDERPVWFGCDVGKSFDRDLGLMDAELYDYEGVYRTPFALDKAQRLDYGASQMTHAMVFTGVDLDENDKPLKWRVENSWGDKHGDKGFMVMTDKWFDEFNYEVVVDKKYLSAETLAILDTAPEVLPPWHPMGALAR
jgi:bleomycin hydrolase